MQVIQPKYAIQRPKNAKSSTENCKSLVKNIASHQLKNVRIETCEAKNSNSYVKFPMPPHMRKNSFRLKEIFMK